MSIEKVIEHVDKEPLLYFYNKNTLNYFVITIVIRSLNLLFFPNFLPILYIHSIHPLYKVTKCCNL